MRRIWLALAAIGLSFFVSVAILVGADLYVHRKFEAAAGLNWRGYRGAVVGRKAPGEYRVVVLGGSTTLGYGVTWTDAFPAQLERDLRERANGPVSVVNLGYNNDGAYSLRFTLADYAKLSPDVAILYEGYNDLGGVDRNTQIGRRQSFVFRASGYFPMLPMVMTEKLMALRYGGDLDAAYRGEKIVFRPTSTQRVTIGVLASATNVSDAVARALTERTPPQVVGENGKIAAYCDDVAQAVRLARSRSVAVLVVGQPFTKGSLRDTHRAQQRALAARTAADFGGDPAVRYVSLGDAIDLNDRALAWDGMHLTPRGNTIIANALTEPILELMGSGQGEPARRSPGR